MSTATRKSRSAAASPTRRERDFFDNFLDLEYLETKFLEYLGRFKYPKAEKYQILKALDFAKLAHNGQKRDEGVPYVTHPIRVANILLHEVAEMDASLVCTALLHDVIEDCGITIRELKNNFNDNIAHMVKVLSKDPRIENHKRVYYEGIVVAPLEIKLVKVCDRLDNLRSLRFTHNKARIKRYTGETEKKYCPIAQSIDGYLFRELKQEIIYLRNRRT